MLLMAVDINTIVTLYKKGESNFCISKSYIFAVLFIMLLKSSRKLVKRATDQARAENEQSEQSVW